MVAKEKQNGEVQEIDGSSSAVILGEFGLGFLSATLALKLLKNPGVR